MRDLLLHGDGASRVQLRRVIQIWIYLASVARTLTADFVPSLISCRAPAGYLQMSEHLELPVRP